MKPTKYRSGALQFGDSVPDFECHTTAGYIESFRKYKGDKWAILCSHPADFTPICTTELSSMVAAYDEFVALDCQLFVVGTDSVDMHLQWEADVLAYANTDKKRRRVPFPIIGDENREISMLFGMLDRGFVHSDGLTAPNRSVFFITPENKIAMSLSYPHQVGRNVDEILRCVKALQLTHNKPIGTPANWPNNVAPSVCDKQGQHQTERVGDVVLLPAMSNATAEKEYPNHSTCRVPSNKDYIRLVQLEDVQPKLEKAAPECPLVKPVPKNSPPRLEIKDKGRPGQSSNMDGPSNPVKRWGWKRILQSRKSL